MKNQLNCEVIMLPTEMSNLVIRPNGKLYLAINDEIEKFERDIRGGEEQYWDPQHLYIVSNNDIKEGNWFIDVSDKKIYQNEAKESMPKNIFPECLKIEATTNPELKLPLIPQSFIEEYVKLSGKIKEVNIEMEDICDETCNDIPSNINECCGQPNWKIKTNSDNTVIIHPIINDELLINIKTQNKMKTIEESKEDYRNELFEKEYGISDKKYSREDVINICEILNLAHQIKRISGEESTFDFDKWIEENL